MSDGEIG